MGRYMRKNKVTMEVAQSALGVRTRARTLAMQRQEVSKEQQVLNLCYLELRSRKLEKFSQVNRRYKKPPKTTKARVSAAPKASVRTGHVVSVGAATISRSNSFSSLPAASPPVADVEPAVHSSALELRAAEIEASWGENAFDHDGHSSRDSFGQDHFRRLRESTPTCNEQEHLPEAPGSTSRVRAYLTTSSRLSCPLLSASPAKHQHQLLDVPSLEEIEDFFAAREEPAEDKLRLSVRYNYDFVNDVPLPGRFEWTRSL